MIILKSPHIPRGLGLPQLSTFLQLFLVLGEKKQNRCYFCLTSLQLRKHLASSVIRPGRSPAVEAGPSFGDLVADISEEALGSRMQKYTSSFARFTKT